MLLHHNQKIKIATCSHIPQPCNNDEVQKSQISCKIYQIKMAQQYVQLHMVTKNPTKFEQNLLSGIPEIPSTKSSVTDG